MYWAVDRGWGDRHICKEAEHFAREAIWRRCWVFWVDKHGRGRLGVGTGIFVARLDQCAEDRAQSYHLNLVFVDGLWGGRGGENVGRLVVGVRFCCVGSDVSVFPVFL